MRTGRRHGRTRGPLRIRWDERNQPQPWRLICWTFRRCAAVAAHLRRFSRLVASGTNAPPFNLQAKAVQQISSRSAENVAAPANQRQTKLVPISAVSSECCKYLFSKNNRPMGHLSEYTYTTKIRFTFRNGLIYIPCCIFLQFGPIIGAVRAADKAKVICEYRVTLVSQKLVLVNCRVARVDTW